MALAQARLNANDTKTRILDAAESLFVAGGFDALSMRQITTSAGVNLAAVNYHFGSKDALIQAVLARQLDPLNQMRQQLLTALEQELGERLSCEHVMVAMFLPAIRLSRTGAPNAERFLHFLGRVYTDPSPVVRDFISTHYLDTLGRFFLAFQSTLPELTRADLGFRLNFAMSAIAGLLAGGNAQRLINDFTQGQADQEGMLLARLISLMVAALRAPLAGPGDSSVLEQVLQLPLVAQTLSAV